MSELRDLLERSPSIVNVAFTEGRTALYWAVCNGREDAIRLLLKHQARGVAPCSYHPLLT